MGMDSQRPTFDPIFAPELTVDRLVTELLIINHMLGQLVASAAWIGLRAEREFTSDVDGSGIDMRIRPTERERCQTNYRLMTIKPSGEYVLF